jgi:putative transposase
MSRFARVVIPGCPHHITQRGNARREVFFSRSDRHVYLGLLRQYAEHYALENLGYCLMTNHVHLVVTPTAPNSPGRTLREVNMRYAQYRNAFEQSCGHIWQGRFFSCPVDPSRLGTVMRYVELNPVRAGLVAEAAQYEWSSAVAHLGGPDRSSLLAMEDWAGWWPSPEWALVLQSGAEESAAIREATYSGRPLGSDEFVEQLERSLDRRLKRGQPGRPRGEPRTGQRM